ncbi:Gfo/Idh/MocA family oxidoreductase [Salipiger sp. 1_MG-2023]|uniref:Gfo/Idh/MocA family protein n=1 Tax=Salipiger sp. 1_MG-2023 TaxID=3062665 RepID=UPI0026E3BBD2|nr:Gfo/Idh/MocA family oxidoreductase [Salipiger sp. 1_MG-2023]MDO6588309.1 Gfo/Idh/MocA family oxidoreductase [Salipiger sp. 1_MG-2023]
MTHPPLRVGVMGCGNISDTYLKNASLWRHIEFVACADLSVEAAQRKADIYDLKAMSVAEMIAADDVDIVLNLTIPSAHADVSIAALEAGKHVYTEKPLAAHFADGQRILKAARKAGRRVGSAPDTVLGPGFQTGRAIHDSGQMGEVITGLAAVLSRGMEHWHPNPSFFFQQGGGPVLDLGPYYLAALVSILGPVRRVQASGRIGRAKRLVTGEGPMKGQTVPVETFTTLNALLSFEGGAEITFLASWDVPHSDLRPIELHGTNGTLRLPDPNMFGGTVAFAEVGGTFDVTSTSEQPFGADNRLWMEKFPYTCYRGLGLADMARALQAGEDFRCSEDFSLHVLEVLFAIEDAAQNGRGVELTTTCTRPTAMAFEQARDLLAKQADIV